MIKSNSLSVYLRCRLWTLNSKRMHDRVIIVAFWAKETVYRRQIQQLGSILRLLLLDKTCNLPTNRFPVNDSFRLIFVLKVFFPFSRSLNPHVLYSDSRLILWRTIAVVDLRRIFKNLSSLCPHHPHIPYLPSSPLPRPP